MGHSNRTFADFVDLLHAYGVDCLIDIRRHPVSSRFPHFNKKHLERHLPANNIVYLWFGDALGGMRDPDYQAYMHTEAFREGLQQVERATHERLTALMCAEKYPQDCHRRFVAEQLAVSGWRVSHIITKGICVAQQSELL